MKPHPVPFAVETKAVTEETSTAVDEKVPKGLQEGDVSLEEAVGFHRS